MVSNYVLAGYKYGCGTLTVEEPKPEQVISADPRGFVVIPYVLHLKTDSYCICSGKLVKVAVILPGKPAVNKVVGTAPGSEQEQEYFGRIGPIDVRDIVYGPGKKARCIFRANVDWGPREEVVFYIYWVNAPGDGGQKPVSPARPFRPGEQMDGCGWIQLVKPEGGETYRGNLISPVEIRVNVEDPACAAKPVWVEIQDQSTGKIVDSYQLFYSPKTGQGMVWNNPITVKTSDLEFIQGKARATLRIILKGQNKTVTSHATIFFVDQSQPGREDNCVDGVDNDGDGSTDCKDPDCKDHPSCKGECQDECPEWLKDKTWGISYDPGQRMIQLMTCVEGADGCNKIEYTNKVCPQCTNKPDTKCGYCCLDYKDGVCDPDCEELKWLGYDDPDCTGQQQNEDCEDGVDNDGDNKIDCGDEDCKDHPRCKQAPPEDCTNKVDDDLDGLVDCDDPDCADDPACQMEEDCTNGRDDDGDGLVDCDDPDCEDHPECKEEAKPKEEKGRPITGLGGTKLFILVVFIGGIFIIAWYMIWLRKKP